MCFTAEQLNGNISDVENTIVIQFSYDYSGIGQTADRVLAILLFTVGFEFAGVGTLAVSIYVAYGFSARYISPELVNGIGARLTVTTGLGQTLTREIQLGGGFMSFDAPLAHFGLGAATEITTLQIDWPDGDKSTLATPLAAGNLYHVLRQP